MKIKSTRHQGRCLRPFSCASTGWSYIPCLKRFTTGKAPCFLLFVCFFFVAFEKKNWFVCGMFFFFAFHIRIAVVSGHWKTRRIRGFPTVPVGRAGRAGPAVWRSVRAIRRRSVLERCRAIEPYLLPNWRRKIENDEIPGHLSLSLSFSYWLSHFAVRHRTIKTRSVHDKVCTFNGTGAFVPRGVPVEKSQ